MTVPCDELAPLPGCLPLRVPESPGICSRFPTTLCRIRGTEFGWMDGWILKAVLLYCMSLHVFKTIKQTIIVLIFCLFFVLSRQNSGEVHLIV